MKKRYITMITDFLAQNWKWLLVGIYLICVWCGWQNREAFRFTLNENVPFYSLYSIICDVFFILIALIPLIGLIKLAMTPLFQRVRFKRAFKRVGIHNSLGEYPILLSKKRDKIKRFGAIYTLKNVGISIVEFDNKNAQLEAALDMKIYHKNFGAKSSRILLYGIRRKHVKPKLLSLNDAYLGNEINFLCVGKTNSGKSYALLMLLGIYAKYVPNISITICDYKKSGFADFEDTPNFYGYRDVPDGIRIFYQEFCERLEANDEERNKHIRVLLIDEYGSLISAQSKNVAEELKTMVGNMLFMGRSLGIRVLIGVQRADAKYFAEGARDQFRAILALGNLSKEQKQMLFYDYKELMNERNGLGEGYLYIDGKDDIERVKIAAIKDIETLNDTIRTAMCR